jgi:cellulose synthase/poly-beta-1,6-N-acetylglucosamine synthase-like glycosyltransferase
MNFLFIIFAIIQVIIALYLLQPFLLLIAHYLKKIIKPYQSPVIKAPLLQKDFHFAAIITAHIDTRFILPMVDSLLKQSYQQLHIYIVADACDISDLSFNDKRITLLKSEKDFNAKIKSIQFAVENFKQEHDALVIFDSDNLAHPDYFSVLNKYFQQGYKAVQTQMLSKNTQTVYAKLDSMGHIYYSFLDRKSRMELGLSSHILGLGIAVDCKLYDQIMYKDRLGGFDKKLQADLIKNVSQLAYAEEAIVYDEKVDDGATLEKQRTRWLFTYFHYFKISLDVLLSGIKKFNFNLFYFGFALLRPPLIIMIGLALFATLLNLFIQPLYSFIWLIILIVYGFSFIAIIISQSQQLGIKTALLFLPIFAFRQVKALFKIKTAGKSFLKTEHNNVLYIEDILK